jgi:hypothetical protein
MPKKKKWNFQKKKVVQADTASEPNGSDSASNGTHEAEKEKDSIPDVSTTPVVFKTPAQPPPKPPSSVGSSSAASDRSSRSMSTKTTAKPQLPEKIDPISVDAWRVQGAKALVHWF